VTSEEVVGSTTMGGMPLDGSCTEDEAGTIVSGRPEEGTTTEDVAGMIVSGRPVEEPTAGAVDEGGATDDGTAGFVPTSVFEG